ncbi:MAG: hypothetical protein ACI97B_001139 [Verrucomicrobiales bacterium]|jgi:hypothetical protein
MQLSIFTTFRLATVIILLAPGLLNGQVRINELSAGRSDRLLNWQDGVARIGIGPMWYERAHKDDFWPEGAGGFGYGDGDDTTLLNTEMQGVTHSLYIRKVFTVSAANAARNELLELSVDYDDGFVAYLNGKEIARNNLGATGSFVYRDQPAYSEHEAGTPETITLGPANTLLLTGENILAIQVHNRTLAGDDLSILANLKITSPDTALVNQGDTWRYFVGLIEPSGGFFDKHLLGDAAATLQVEWGKPAFNDITWGTGPGPLGYPASLATGTDLRDELRLKAFSLYIRQSFAASAAAANSSEVLELSMDYDDGYVAYLNGVEVARSTTLGIPGEFVPFDTKTSSGRSAGLVETILLAPASKYLVEGANVLAIQVHNASVASSDLVIFGDLALTGPNPESLATTTNDWRYFVGTSEPALPPEDSALDLITEFPDWLELVNTTAASISLGGWSLSDNPSRPDKWRFPPMSLAPNEHRVIFCTGLNLSDPDGNLHTNFGLHMDGEPLALYNASGQMISEIDYPQQHLFYAYGWDSTATAYRFFDSVSPGDSNTESSFTEIVKKPKLDPDPGFYASPLVVTASVNDVSATIYYTTDGSIPSTTNGTQVTGPITLNTSTSLRIRAIKAGAVPSKTVTRSYLLDQPAAVQAVPAILITGHEPQAMYAPHGVASIVGGTYVNGIWNATGPDDYNIPMHRGRPWEREVSFEVINGPSNEWVQVEAGLRMSGSNYTRPRYILNQSDLDDRWDGNAHKDKPQFNMFFRKVYGAGRLDYALMPNWPIASFDGLRLRGGKNDYDNPFITDELMRRLFINCGQPGSPGVIANLYYNGEYKSYYNPAARYIEAFFQDAYNSPYGWDIINHGGLSNGTQTFWNDARAFRDASSTDLTDLTDYDRMLTYVDPVNFADYLIVNTYASTWDWPQNNWYAARERSPTGRYGWYIWDAEGGLGRGRDPVTYDPFTVDLLQKSNDTPRYYQELVQSPEWRLLFADRIYKHFFRDGPMSDNRITYEYTYLKDRFSPLRQEIKGGGINGGGIESWISNRRAPYFNQLRTHGLWPDTIAPDFDTPPGVVAPLSAIAITHSNTTGTIYYTLDGSDPRAPGGAIAGNAYTGPITLDRSRDIKARVLENSEWSPLAESTYISDLPPLVITEIMYNPSLHADAEYIEVKNIGTNDVELGSLSLDGVTFSFPGGQLTPGEHLVVAKNPTVLSALYDTSGFQLFGPFISGSLDNAGEELALVHSTFGDIQRFTYKDSWYPQTDGGGFSLTIRNENADPTLWNEKSGWRASDPLQGTPGIDDPGELPLPRAIVINEVLTHTDASPVGDWIELLNQSGDDINIGGWFLSDSFSNLHKYRIPDNTIIPAGGYRVFDATNHFRHASTAQPFGLSELGETAYLCSALPTGELTGYLNQEDFGAAEKEVTFGRTTRSDLEVDFVAMRSATKGSANGPPLVGPVVISEVMYHPLAGMAEYIKLYNTSGDPVPLFDPAVPTNTWQLSDAIDFSFPTGVTLQGHECLFVCATNPAAFRALHGLDAGVPVFGPYSGNLNNAGDDLKLARPGMPEPGTNIVPIIRVDRVAYEEVTPWPAAADGTGPSLHRVPMGAYGNDPLHWTTGALAGTPEVCLGYDSDADGVPDTWESRFHLNAMNAADAESDLDLDLADARTEYVTGTDPEDGNDLLTLLVKNYTPFVTVSFMSRQTSGTDYMNLDRKYTLECMTNWPGGAWEPISGFSNLTGNNQIINYTNAAPEHTDNTVYRAKVWLD